MRYDKEKRYLLTIEFMELKSPSLVQISFRYFDSVRGIYTLKPITKHPKQEINDLKAFCVSDGLFNSINHFLYRNSGF